MFWAALFSCVHDIPASFISLSTDLLYDCLGRPTFLFPCGFQSSACLVTLSAGLRSVWSIHPHFLFLMSWLMGFWLVLLHRSVFEISSGHLMLMIRCLLFTKVFNLLVMA
ncbi:hypothetical protein DPMN_007418 [Dreissena polymorpha]|uniref:Uncharacterized protein n=1 Tax=Dreissena polymorpha TaxID=45954 RepID=A0A9D4MVT7_DREPO|nr:hypothetical protein DPMN_007418 [Dreissena polymorpha]